MLTRIEFHTTGAVATLNLRSVSFVGAGGSISLEVSAEHFVTHFRLCALKVPLSIALQLC